VRGFEISSEEYDDPMDSVVTDVEEGFKKMKEKIAAKGTGEDDEKLPEPTITAVILMEGQSSIVVGRSDGTVFSVKVGSEAYASFVKKQAIALNPTGSVSMRTDFVREEDLITSTTNMKEEKAEEESEETKFDILMHNSLWPGGIVAMACLDETTFAVATSTPSIHILSTSPKVHPITVPTPNLTPIGVSKLTSDCFVVAYDDGTVQTIRQRGTTAIYFPRDTICFSTKAPLTSLSATPTHVYVGNSEGEIFIAKIDPLDFQLEKIDSATFKPFPSCAVTALHSVEGGTLSSKISEEDDQDDSTTTVLLAGSENGEVKQYEIIPTQGGDVTHWPRLKNQKLKRRAHVFEGNNVKITNIVGDHSKVITACEDGSVRFYSPRDGRQCSYTMDGLDGITQMSLGEEMLITNGMEKGFVCIHDFGIIEDSVDFGVVEMDD